MKNIINLLEEIKAKSTAVTETSPVDTNDKTLNKPHPLLSSDLSEPVFSTPIDTLRKKITPINRKNRNRLQKVKAKEKLTKIFKQESDTSEEETGSNWIPYNAAKKIKSIRRLKS
jgi:transposase